PLLASAGTSTATLNGQAYIFSAASISAINVNLLGGSDRLDHLGGVPGFFFKQKTAYEIIDLHPANAAGPMLNIYGNDGDDQVVLESRYVTPVRVNGGNGSDRVIYNGTLGDDRLSVNPQRTLEDNAAVASHRQVMP